MKRKLLPFLMLFSALLTLTSCLSSEEDTTVYYDDTAITSFKLGTLNQKVVTTNSDQTTTTSKTTVDCSGYAFYINQATREIYNPDSLPYGVDASKVICTISSKNSGTVTIKSLTSDSLRYYSNADSIDFTQPRQFTVYSNSGNYSRTYTIRVNVHQQQGGIFGWDNLGTDETLAALADMKALATEDRLYVFGNLNGEARIYSRPLTKAGTFARVSPNIALPVDVSRNVIAMGNVLYTLRDGQLMRSSDAASWTAVGTVSLQQLLGATDSRMYAYGTDGSLKTSTDGTQWTDETLLDDRSMLPVTDLNLCYLPSKTNKYTNQVILIGNRTVATDAAAMVWGTVEENAEGSEHQPWSHYIFTGDNQHQAPHLLNLKVIAYNGGLLAMGGAGQGGSQEKAFTQFYRSIDRGITWHNDSLYVLPAGFASSETSFALAVDRQQFIWIVAGGTGQLWRGRLTDLGWKKEDTVFTE